VTTRKSGFGIGLAVSKTIIERHNGDIWVENSKDGGAEFFFKLKTV
jgi:signal transduction histidine kinase